MNLRIVLLLLTSFTLCYGINYVGNISGFFVGDRFGIELSCVGDINGDGYEDFAVGAPGRLQDKEYGGAVYIYFGGKSGFKNPLVLKGEKPGDRFGISVARLGDFDRDGYDDFACGACGSDDVGVDAGKVYIFRGGKNFETTPYKLLMGERKNSWFGFELDGGKDINGDGEPDLVVGAPYGGKKYAGSLYIYISGNFEKPALVIEGTESGELFGSSVDIDADLTGDLINDIVVGAYYSSPKGKNTAGRVYIYNGGSIIAPTPAKIIDGERDGGWFGFSLLLCGDINGDGVSELVVSAPKDGEGKVFVYSYADISKPVLVLKGAMENESFGYSLSVCGDINGDGFFDLIVGSPANFENGYRCGKAYIFLTGKTMDEKADYQITGRNAGDELGYSLGFVPEYWGKGKNIILVGLPATEANKSGSVQIYR